MQERSKACHKEVIMRSQQVVVKMPLEGSYDNTHGSDR